MNDNEQKLADEKASMAAAAADAAARAANRKPASRKADPNDDDEWQSTPGADTGRFIVKCKIRGKVQGRELKLGTLATLELTDDIADLIRPGVLEPVGAMDES